MALNRTFLGYAFKQEKNGTVIVSRRTNKKVVWYSNWKTSALRYADREYHIVNNGILTRNIVVQLSRHKFNLFYNELIYVVEKGEDAPPYAA